MQGDRKLVEGDALLAAVDEAELKHGLVVCLEVELAHVAVHLVRGRVVHDVVVANRDDQVDWPRFVDTDVLELHDWIPRAGALVAQIVLHEVHWPSQGL